MTNVIKILPALILLFSCNPSEKGEGKEDTVSSFADTVIFPDSLQSDYATPVPDSKYILVTFVDSGNCAPCALNRLKILQHHQEDFDRMETEFLLIIENTDTVYVREALSQLHIGYPVIMDTACRFRQANRFISETGLRSFVINRNREIIWKGSPVETKKTWEQFRKKVASIEVKG